MSQSESVHYLSDSFIWSWMDASIWSIFEPKWNMQSSVCMCKKNFHWMNEWKWCSGEMFNLLHSKTFSTIVFYIQQLHYIHLNMFVLKHIKSFLCGFIFHFSSIQVFTTLPCCHFFFHLIAYTQLEGKAPPFLLWYVACKHQREKCVCVCIRMNFIIVSNYLLVSHVWKSH